MKKRFVQFSAGIVTLLLFTTGNPLRAQQDDLKRFAGTWLMFDMELNGDGIGRADAKKIIFAGNTYTFYHLNNKSPEATFKLNTTSEPRTIDVTTSGNTMLGIYRFKDGRLEICLSHDGKPRPKIFSTRPDLGAGNVLYVLKPKDPPAKLDPVEAEFQAQLSKLTGKWIGENREVNGRPDKDASTHGMLIENGKCTTLFRGRARDTMTVLRIDAKANPPQIDFRTASGKLWLGIFRMIDNKLEICFANTDLNKRPTAFTTKPESGAGSVYTVYKLEK